MNKSYHFIGIGGIGMSALASLLLDKGFKVSGSDVRTNPVIDRLKKQGAEIFLGHASQNIDGSDCIVFSSAISNSNPELMEAQKKQIPILQRAKLLAELMRGHIGITIAGAHGKTTTSSMIANLLVMAGFRPTTAVGGIVSGSNSHAQLGKGKYFVTEVDESDGSFLYFLPHYSVITNIDFEHIDYYRNWQNILAAYKKFIGQTVEDGIILGYGDDERLLKLLKESKKNFKTYGFSPQNDFYPAQIAFNQFESRFHCMSDGKDLGQVILNTPGKHNVANALACISLGLNLSIDFDVICNSLKEYRGVQRRFQLKGVVDDIWVIDDYAHHPTEIRAILDTAQLFKQSLPGQGNELITVFQPHRYSRVKGLMIEFAESLIQSDHLIVTDIYAASENPIDGITAENLCEKIRERSNKPVHYVSKEGIVDYLLEIVKPQDIVMTLGAGDITNIADQFINTLKQQSSIVEKA